MEQRNIQIETLSPLAMRSDHAAQNEKTARVISGSTLWGALASVYRQFYPEREERFAHFFLREHVFYPYLYPANFSGKAANADCAVYAAPGTAISCKRHSGFLRKDYSDYHGVRDSLLGWTQFKLSGEKSIQHLVQHQYCAQCQASMDSLSEEHRYYRRMPGEVDRRVSAKLQTRLQTRTGINREWNTVENGILYNREVIERGTRFWGAITFTPRFFDEPDALDEFIGFVEEANDSGLIRLGTGRTRGLGRINLRFKEQNEQEDQKHFQQRLFAFNDKVHQPGNTMKNAFYFAITLQTPLLLRDPWLRYTCDISTHHLKEITGLPEESFQPIYQLSNMTRVIGWNGVLGMPRVQEYAISTGSVFLFAFSYENQEKDVTKLISHLFRLEQEGAGLRRTEGFGRVCVSDAFHVEGDSL